LKQRLDFIDGLRGFAALMVVAAHSMYFNGTYAFKLGPLNVSQVLGWGVFGVNLFMVISGFVLAYPLVQSDGWRELRLRDFFVRRALRILPPYWGAILLFTVLGVVVPLLYHALGSNLSGAFPSLSRSLTAIPTHLFFVHNAALAFNPNFPQISGSFWSLELEVQFYLCFPLLIWWARRWGIFNMVGGVLLITATWRAISWGALVPYNNYYLTRLISWVAPGRLFEFALGILAAYLVVCYREQIRPVTSLLLAVVFFWLGYSYMYVRLGDLSPLIDLFIGTAFFFLLLSTSGSGIAQAVFSWRPLVAVGAFSYSLYLLQEPLIMQFSSWFPLMNGAAAFFGYTIGVGLLVVLSSYLFYLVVEKPAIAWGRRLARRQQAHTPADPALEQPVVAAASEQHAAP